MKIVALMVCAVLMIGAGPASQPTTQPSKLEAAQHRQVELSATFDDLTAKLSEASSHLRDCREKVLANLRSTPEYKSKQLELNAKQVELEEARKSKAPEQRMVIGSEFTKLKSELLRMEATAISSDKPSKDATAAVADLTSKLADAKSQLKVAADEIEKEEQAERSRLEKMTIFDRGRTLKEGMTEAEIISKMGSDPAHRLTNSDGTEGMRWDLIQLITSGGTGGYGGDVAPPSVIGSRVIGSVTVWMQGGKATEIQISQ